MATTQLKCGCIFDGKSFTKYCREHALMVLKKRGEKWAATLKNPDPGRGAGTIDG
jgi:hypothetical protein